MKQQFIYYILNNILESHNHVIYKQVRNISLYKNTQFRSGAILLFNFLGVYTTLLDTYTIEQNHHKQAITLKHDKTTEMI